MIGYANVIKTVTRSANWLSLKEVVLNPIFSAARSINALSSEEILTSIDSDFLALMLVISKTIPLPAFIVYTI